MERREGGEKGKGKGEDGGRENVFGSFCNVDEEVNSSWVKLICKRRKGMSTGIYIEYWQLFRRRKRSRMKIRRNNDKLSKLSLRIL